MVTQFPVIDPVATGKNIARLRKARGLTVRQLQEWFGFDEPQAIYKWQWGKSLPSVDNLYALGVLLEVPMEDILVPLAPQPNKKESVSHPSAARSLFVFFCPTLLNTAGFVRPVPIFHRSRASSLLPPKQAQTESTVRWYFYPSCKYLFKKRNRDSASLGTGVFAQDGRLGGQRLSRCSLNASFPANHQLTIFRQITPIIYLCAAL